MQLFGHDMVAPPPIRQISPTAHILCQPQQVIPSRLWFRYTVLFSFPTRTATSILAAKSEKTALLLRVGPKCMHLHSLLPSQHKDLKPHHKSFNSNFTICRIQLDTSIWRVQSAPVYADKRIRSLGRSIR